MSWPRPRPRSSAKARNRSAGRGLLLPTPLGRCRIHPLVHRLEGAPLGRGLHRDGGVLGVGVAGHRHVAGHEGDPARVVLAQLLDERVGRPARLALEVEPLDQSDAAGAGLTEAVAVLAHQLDAAVGAGLTVGPPGEEERRHDDGECGDQCDRHLEVGAQQGLLLLRSTPA